MKQVKLNPFLLLSFPGGLIDLVSPGIRVDSRNRKHQKDQPQCKARCVALHGWWWDSLSKGRPTEPDEGSPQLHRVTPHHYNSLLVEESVKERPSEQDGSSPDDLANLVAALPVCHSSVTSLT